MQRKGPKSQNKEHFTSQPKQQDPPAQSNRTPSQNQGVSQFNCFVVNQDGDGKNNVTITNTLTTYVNVSPIQFDFNSLRQTGSENSIRINNTVISAAVKSFTDPNGTKPTRGSSYQSNPWTDNSTNGALPHSNMGPSSSDDSM